MSSTDSNQNQGRIYVNWVDRRILLGDRVLHFNMHNSDTGREQFHEALKGEGFSYCPVCEADLSEVESSGRWFEF